MSSVYYVETDTPLRLDGLRDQDGALLAGTVSLEELIDLETGENAEGMTLPAAFTALGAGNYEVELPAELAVEMADTLKAKIRVEAGGLIATFFERILVRERAE